MVGIIFMFPSLHSIARPTPDANMLLAGRAVGRVRWQAEQLALVRLGVANVRWVCAAPRLATHRKQMPIGANGHWLLKLRFLKH